ncbi:invasion associated locus B family protein [Roseomonas sp. GC11]|uniref:invasion associated locus B family protein n=1 Tax=Roseomonas sp. GC11 TaxID=2950546 RepID=UPI00210DE6E8|nr:invasion associated locus B family protein [Roseomonas sp. GC11]MCQ4161573.1 invasion associated locus B family protein [Roseomonas sp. GC11]
MMLRLCLLASALLAPALLAAGPAAAQTGRTAPAAPPPAAPAARAPAPELVPERTSSSFGDWIVRCENRPPEGTIPASRLCEMAQGVQNQQQQPIAQIALGRLARNQPWRLVVAVPVNFHGPTGMRLAPEEGGQPLALQLRSCTPQNCTLEVELTEALQRRLRAREGGMGRFEYRLANEAEMAIPVSFRGFGQAFEALQREPG